MRKLVCLILFFMVFSFAETEGGFAEAEKSLADAEGARVEMEGGLAELEDDSLEYIDGSTRSVGIFERYSHGIKTAKHMASLGIELTAWGNHADFNVNADYGRWLAKGVYLSSGLFNYHILSDVGDSCTNSKGCARIGAGIAINGVLAMASFVDAWIFGSETIARIWFGLATLLNPTLEFFVVQKYVPISIGLGYNTDWFAFSPGHKFYLRAHGDLNLNITWARISASYSYSFLDTYDLKKGSKKFYVKLILGPIF